MIPSTSFTLASPITFVTSVTLAILVTSVILVNVVTHHLATLRTLPHSLPHPKLPLPNLPLLPPFKTFADPVASAIDHIENRSSLIHFDFANYFEFNFNSKDAQKGGSRRCTCGKKNNTAHLNSTRGSQETQQCLFFVLKL